MLGETPVEVIESALSAALTESLRYIPAHRPAAIARYLLELEQ